MTYTDTSSDYTDYVDTTMYVDPDDNSTTKKIDSRIKTTIITTSSSTIPSAGNGVEKKSDTPSTKKAKKAKKNVLSSKMGDADSTSEQETTKGAFRFGKV